MKKSYDKSIKLLCITCGDSNFEFNQDISWVKCNRCGREYPGGYDELVELNQAYINNEIDGIGKEINKDIEKDFTKMLKDAFKGNKNIKIK